jgi:hypothetical protein
MHAGDFHNLMNQALPFARSKNQPCVHHLHEFGCVVAENPLHGRVHIGEPPFKVCGHHHGASRVQQILHPLAGSRSPGFCLVEINANRYDDGPDCSGCHHQPIELWPNGQARRNGYCG